MGTFACVASSSKTGGHPPPPPPPTSPPCTYRTYARTLLHTAPAHTCRPPSSPSNKTRCASRIPQAHLSAQQRLAMARIGELAGTQPKILCVPTPTAGVMQNTALSSIFAIIFSQDQPLRSNYSIKCLFITDTKAGWRLYLSPFLQIGVLAEYHHKDCLGCN